MGFTLYFIIRPTFAFFNRVGGQVGRASHYKLSHKLFLLYLIFIVEPTFSFFFQFSRGCGLSKVSVLGLVWYMCLKTENCCLKTFVKIRVGEKVY